MTEDPGSSQQFAAGDPAGKNARVWQFNLTSTEPGATITASFSDGTSVSGQAESEHTGNVSKFFITTALDATLVSASVTFTPAAGGNSQLTVSHCIRGSTTPTTPTTPTQPEGPGGEVVEQDSGQTQVGGVSATRPRPVIARPNLTG